MRLTLSWVRAATLPKIMVAAAATQITTRQCSTPGANAPRNRRMNMANAAAFGATEIKAVTGVGAPS